MPVPYFQLFLVSEKLHRKYSRNWTKLSQSQYFTGRLQKPEGDPEGGPGRVAKLWEDFGRDGFTGRVTDVELCEVSRPCSSIYGAVLSQGHRHARIGVYVDAVSARSLFYGFATLLVGVDTPSFVTHPFRCRCCVGIVTDLCFNWL
jgi:hypothetical protein